ncbi:MAG: hypothetical protein ABA06_01660 [Parcubacteria bacterium C7867-001]|nr:MAG: hypothetical protein ABA06_01660 [Parcubacteria bacterium C7867-001]
MANKPSGYGWFFIATFLISGLVMGDFILSLSNTYRSHVAIEFTIFAWIITAFGLLTYMVQMARSHGAHVRTITFLTSVVAAMGMYYLFEQLLPASFAKQFAPGPGGMIAHGLLLLIPWWGVAGAISLLVPALVERRWRVVAMHS